MTDDCVIEVPAVQVTDVSKHFAIRVRGSIRKTKVPAVRELSISLYRGKTLALVGESGCGKSTTGRIVAGLLNPDSGSVLFDGNPIQVDGRRNKRLDLYRRVQMIFQDPQSSLSPRIRIGAAIEEGLAIHNIGDRKSRRERSMALLEDVGLRADHFYRLPHELSGGQQQRVGLARALALDPDVVVCDEPVSALDISVQAQVLNLLKQTQRSRNAAFLFISHDLNVVRYIADTIAVMYLGRIVEVGSVDQIFNSPKHPYTRVLLNSIPRVGGFLQHTLDANFPDEPVLPSSGLSGCPFRPRCVDAMEICSKKRPELNAPSFSHRVACHLYE